MPWVLDLSDGDPGGADLFVRSALRKCWDALPRDRQTVAEVERTFRRLVDRALRDLREDADEFQTAEQPEAAAAGPAATPDGGSRVGDGHGHPAGDPV